MRLTYFTSLATLVILLSGRACDARPETGPNANSEYRRILSGLKQGTLSLPAQNISSKPWTYSSQGQEFGAKLKERKSINISSVRSLLVNIHQC
jgi:hypothetical protein